MRRCLLTLLCLLLLVPASQAQVEAAHWFMGNLELDFTATPPTLRLNRIPYNVTGLLAATYSDPLTGRLLLVASYNGIFDGAGQRLPNGTLDKADIGDPVSSIVPRPGHPDRYYVIYLGWLTSQRTEWALYYAEVDLAANNGRGQVLQKDQLLMAYTNSAPFTVYGPCAGGSYWLVAGFWARATPNGSSPLMAYEITAAGISPIGVQSMPLPSVSTLWPRLSPTGDFLTYSYWDGTDGGLALGRFDQSTGQVSLVTRLSKNGWGTAFSPGGTRLYLLNTDTLLQYDLSTPTPAAIRASRTVVANWRRPWEEGGDMQLGPDGQIYVTPPFGGDTTISIIERPELLGAACSFRRNVYVDRRLGRLLPRCFPTNLLYRSPLQPDAGPDRTVCPGDAVVLGTGSQPGPVSWQPATYLSSSSAAAPTFRYTGPALSVATDFTYAVSVADGGCLRTDLVKIRVLPGPQAPVISGSRSVCPGIRGVAYSVPAQVGVTYRWTVAGGVIVGGQGTAQLLVDWGPRNAGAEVRLVLGNATSCQPAAVLPVRINAALQTEKPGGPAPVCQNQLTGLTYAVTNTAGSVYTWGIRGGTLRGGQGSSQVTVDWAGPGRHRLWVQERTVADTICYGVSDTLRVQVYQDSTQLQLRSVSIGPDDNSHAELRWQAAPQPLQNAQPLTVLRRVADSGAPWQPVGTLPPTQPQFLDQGLQAADYGYEYLLRGTNDCGLPLESAPHRPVWLQAQAAPDNLQLRWSAYAGWPAGPGQYELWQRPDDQPAYTLLARSAGAAPRQVSLSAFTARTHRYRIRAVKADEPTVAAWSNEVTLSFEHALPIPNVFTPNGDGRNDTFVIPRLALYPDNELFIYNRLGRQLHHWSGYQGTWDAADVPAGTYYYLLRLGGTGRSYRGWVEVVK